MDSPTDAPRPALNHQLSSAGNSPLSSRPGSPAAAAQHPFYDYRSERAHLTDKGAFQSELPTALHPPLPANANAPVAAVTPGLDRLTLQNLTLSNSTAPPSPEASNTSATTRTRTRSESLTSNRAKGDLTSPRIANLGLTPASPEPKAPQGYVDHGPPNLNSELEDAEEIDEGFTARESPFSVPRLRPNQPDACLASVRLHQRTPTRSSRQS